MKPVIAANWKMNLTKSEAIHYANQLKSDVKSHENATIILAPSSCFLSVVSDILADVPVSIAAQSVASHDSGAFTGEVSAQMLQDCGATHALIGHSERRMLFNESNAVLTQQLNQCNLAQLVPILCVGETLEQRNDRNAILKNQLSIIHTIKGPFMVAYEPVWAIGTGVAATPEDAQSAHEYIRSQVGPSCPILYGGSVKVSNTQSIMAQEDVNGVLVGGASLDPIHFSQIIQESRRSYA